MDRGWYSCWLALRPPRRARRQDGSGVAAGAVGRSVLVGLLLLAVTLPLAACGKKNTIVPDATADTVTRFVEHKTGFKPTDVKCPDGIEAKVGGTFDCHFTGPEGPYTATLTIRSVDGTKVVYAIDSHRDG